jgi:hypothetical protein
MITVALNFLGRIDQPILREQKPVCVKRFLKKHAVFSRHPVTGSFSVKIGDKV